MRRCLPHLSSWEQGIAVRRAGEVAAGLCLCFDRSRIGQVDRVRSHEVLVPETAERRHEAKPRPENRGNQVGVHGQHHSGQVYIRTDAPTGSRDAFSMTLAAAAQGGWDYSVFDAQSAYLQSDGIERPMLLRMPHKNPIPEKKPGQVFFFCCWFDLRDEICWTCVVRVQQDSARGSWFRGVKTGTRPLLLAWTIWT